MPGVIVWLSLLSCGVCTEQIKCMQGGWTHTRALSRIGCHAQALWLDHYVRDAAGTVYGTQLVISLTTKQDYKLHVATASGTTHTGDDSPCDDEYDLEGRPHAQQQAIRPKCCAF
jgi:hypothetical protein